MSFMFEVLYKPASDPRREAVISERVGQFGGRLTFREEPDTVGVGPLCLTYEFGDLRMAQEAATCLRSQGEHVQGPMDYGNASQSTAVPKYGARVFPLASGKALIKQTIKPGLNSNDEYVIDGHRERHVDLSDDGAVAAAVRDALAGRLPP